MKELFELSEEELHLLKYFTLRDTYNYLNPNSEGYRRYSEKTREYKQEHQLRDCLLTWIHNFGEYNKIVFKIISGDSSYESDIEKQIKLGKKKELLVMIEKLYLVFSVDKEENIGVYNRIKQIRDKIHTPSLKEILSKLTDPFDNMEFIKAVNEQMLSNNIVNSRNIYLSTDKKRKDDTAISDEVAIRLSKAYIKDAIEYVLEDYQKGDTSLIPNEKEYQKIKIFLKENEEKLAILLSYRFQRTNPDMTHISLQTKIEYLQNVISKINNEYLRNVISKINAEYNFIDSEHFGIDRKKYRGKDNLMHWINCTRDVRLYITTSCSEYGYLFLMEYIKKCRQNHIECDMKGMDKGNLVDYPGKDQTIFYSFLHDFPTRIKILEEIKREHPEWIETFGSPISGCATLNNSYYGIGHIGAYSINEESSERIGFPVCSANTATYNDCIDNLGEYAFYSTLAKYIVKSNLINKVDSKDRKIVECIAGLQGIRQGTKIGSISSVTIQGKSLEDIRSIFKNGNFIEQLRSLGYSMKDEEWLKALQIRMRAISNVANGFPINKKISPAISKFMYDQAKNSSSERILQEIVKREEQLEQKETTSGTKK